jgi:glycerophosphoryl diester phosphodiesterase
MTVIWTHRGDGIENSLSAFQLAWDKGITHFETDVQTTNDGKLVLAHDNDLLRLTGKNIEISDLTYAQLQQFPIKNQEPWALLDDLVASFPTATISIDMKSGGTLPVSVDWLAKRRNLDRFVFGSFNHSRVVALRSAYPQLNTSISPYELFNLKVGRIVLPNNRNLYAMLPLRKSRVKVLTPTLVAKLQELNIPIHAWTINDQAGFSQVQKLSIDGVVTDHIDLAKSFFK